MAAAGMEISFITIHEISPEPRVRYVSDAVEDILGYQPKEVLNRSIWDFFHPDELDQARRIFGRGVRHDKAASLHYFRARHKSGRFVGCESVYTIAYDVLIACTSVYKQTSKSEKRATDAPIVRRLFSSSPHDPRYHMLSCISSKFSDISNPPTTREPRAALILNRFTRSSAIIFATNSVANVLGLTPTELVSKSFYYCIEESCLQQAVQCIESAKANDTVTYLRFLFRNPSEDEDGTSDNEEDDYENEINSRARDPYASMRAMAGDGMNIDQGPASFNRSGSSEDSGSIRSRASLYSLSSAGSMEELRTSNWDEPPSNIRSQRPAGRREPQLEIEAVVSCSSDGLIVVLRRARPFVPQTIQHPGHPVYANEFASPWGTSRAPSQESLAISFKNHSGGPEPEELMNTIRGHFPSLGGCRHERFFAES